ncbi:MoxR family ATPase, partial [bacterium]|nr:MoxR family ATPase [bacterium]
PLPEAQLDRFLLKVCIDYPEQEAELEVLSSTTGRHEPEVQAVITDEEVLEAQKIVREVMISDSLLEYVNRFVRASRPAISEIPFVEDWVRWGAGPRAGQAMILTAKARALLNERFAVTLADLKAMAVPVLRHRILVNFKAEAQGIESAAVTEKLLAEVPEPKSPLD